MEKITVIIADQGATVKHKTDVANTLLARDYKGFGNQGGNRQPFIIDDLYASRKARVYKETAPTLRSERNGLKVAAAMRGRYNEDGNIEQKIELSDREYSNAITTAQKDALVAEIDTDEIIYDDQRQSRETNCTNDNDFP